jgi:RNA polymerase sigma-70 factor (ECF subfamily)
MISGSALPANLKLHKGLQRQRRALRTDYQELNDAELAARASAGDREAFGAVVDRHQAAVRRVCRAVTGDEHDADDAAQDAFLSALDRLETYDRKRPFGPWLMRIASNAAIDLLRRRAVRKVEPLDEALVASSGSPARDAEQAELRAEIARALAGLPERQRVAITLFDLEGYAHAEIAAVLGVPEGTVRSDVFHARRKLRESLGRYDPARKEEG